MSDNDDSEPVSSSEIETTEDELEGYRIVRAIASELVDPDRIIIRDQKSYCAVLLDDNNRKPIARMWFNSDTTRHFGTFDAEKVETRHMIESLVDIYKHRKAILDRIRVMEKE